MAPWSASSSPRSSQRPSSPCHNDNTSTGSRDRPVVLIVVVVGGGVGWEVVGAQHPPQLRHRRQLGELTQLGIRPPRRPGGDRHDLIQRELTGVERGERHRQLVAPPATVTSWLACADDSPAFHASQCDGEQMPCISHAPVSRASATSCTSSASSTLRWPHRSARRSSSRSSVPSRHASIVHMFDQKDNPDLKKSAGLGRYFAGHARDRNGLAGGRWRCDGMVRRAVAGRGGCAGRAHRGAVGRDRGRPAPRQACGCASTQTSTPRRCRRPRWISGWPPTLTCCST